ncbi:hypothetical protein CCHR01_18885 [Colletotrichum chrysophilum]|uniref:Uncharacterized protein n=1 Tax=Colletotrichum chrysophilum TaxID=1836956 RepID=A0AAD9A0S6_9PEZI|nr:hypothetical protein CCHR01_18885 [Colletotrichum chrysophilum]
MFWEARHSLHTRQSHHRNPIRIQRIGISGHSKDVGGRAR